VPAATELLRALVRRSVRIADVYASAYASSNRLYQVLVTRPGAQPTFNRATATWSNPEDEVLYEGPARVYSVSNGGSLSVGDEPTYYSATRVSIDDLPEGSKMPRRDDLVQVLANAEAEAGGVVGRVFRVDDVELGGLLTAGITMSVSGVAPSRQQT
jgi:hypothetical protein